MSEFVKFPDIKQYRNAVKAVCDHVQHKGKDEEGNHIWDRTIRPPKLTFRGTVKLHGTNAAVRLDADGSTFYQSRERDITPEDDNAGFATWASTVDWSFIRNQFPKKNVVVFGEWCGGSIQSGVALNQIAKMFVIFAVNVAGQWEKLDGLDLLRPERRIFNSLYFQHFTIEIDFSDPKETQNQLVEITTEVEKECPVGKYFGVSGVGEGVVWACLTEGWQDISKFTFKVKGEAHSVSKVKKLASVDPEKLASIKEFVESTVTQNRLEQGIGYLKEMGLDLSAENTGAFLKWLYADIVKEESDTIAASGLDQKEVGSAISKAGRLWYFEKINSCQELTFNQ